MKIVCGRYVLERFGRYISVQFSGGAKLFDNWTEALQWVDRKEGKKHGVSSA